MCGTVETWRPGFCARSWRVTYRIGGSVGAGPFWMGEKNLAPTGIRSSDLPGRSESPYRLHYPSPLLITKNCSVSQTGTSVRSELHVYRQHDAVWSWKLVGAAVLLEHLNAWLGRWGLGLTQRLLSPTAGWSWDCSCGSLLLCSSLGHVPGRWHRLPNQCLLL
jgi:hypothetical protein